MFGELKRERGWVGGKGKSVNSGTLFVLVAMVLCLLFQLLYCGVEAFSASYIVAYMNSLPPGLCLQAF